MRALPVSPSRQPLKVGARLRAARTGLGFTLEQLAQVTGLTKGFISRLEHDGTSPSVSTLVALCEAMSIPVGSLFEAPETHLVRATDAAAVISLSGGEVEEVLVSPRTEPALQMIRSVYPAGTEGDPDLYTINADVEVAHVVSGSLELIFSTTSELLAAGDTLTFTGREPHTWRNPDPKAECVVLWVLVPAPWVAGGVRLRRRRSE